MQEVKHRQEQTDYDTWFRRQVQAGIDSANAGRLVPAEEVEKEFASRRAETLRQFKDQDSPS